MIRLLFFNITILITTCTLASAQDQMQYSLPACKDSESGKFVGERFRLVLPKTVILKQGHDIDYQNYWVGFGKGKGLVWMHGGFGPTWSSGKPTSGWLESTGVLESRSWVFEKNSSKGVDIKGRLANGNYSRFIGMPGETVEYCDVPKDAAEYFDRILDSICFRELR